MGGLLQELRVAGLGIQVLFGFLLSAVAIGLLSAPVAYDRFVFRQHKKARLLRLANDMAVAGLAVVGLVISRAVGADRVHDR